MRTNGHSPSEDVLKILNGRSRLDPQTIFEMASRITTQRFGKTMRLYVPLYLSSNCVNSCPYCSFNSKNNISRKTLKIAEVQNEVNELLKKGHRHILLVSGEDPENITVEYLEELVRSLRSKVSHLSIEVQPLHYKDYIRLKNAGLDGVTLYQETYDRMTYEKYHGIGPKKDFFTRLQTIEYAAKAGIKFIGIGALLGLYDWKKELSSLIKHANYISKKYWTSQIAISFPRIRSNFSNFKAPNPVSDQELAMMIAIARIARPDDDLVLSTREPADLRYKLLPLGITRISAGSKTYPGAYSGSSKCDEQFDVADMLTADEVAKILKRYGYDPIWKDWI